MKLFSTSSTRHLASNIALSPGLCTIKQFSDGEIYVRIDEDVQGQTVWVLAGTQPPAENILELFFLCDALSRAGAHINALITYFAYARQVIAAPREASSTAVISTAIKNLNLEGLYIIHPHSVLLHDFLQFTAIRNTDFFCELAADYDTIAAPDKGAHVLAQEIAEMSNKNLILLTKTRPEQEEVKIVSIDGQVTDKKILIVDDIISTGHTITCSAQALKKLGAKAVAAAVTHGIFSLDSYQLIEESPLEQVFVTNTIAQKEHCKITVVDISQFIQKIMLTSNA